MQVSLRYYFNITLPVVLDKDMRLSGLCMKSSRFSPLVKPAFVLILIGAIDSFANLPFFNIIL